MLSSDQVRVLYARPARFQAAADVAALRALLSPDEQARCDRFRFERDRHIFLVAHALVRSWLAALTGLPAARLAFEAGEHGKPELVDGGRLSGLRFNLSHTHGLVACAAGLDGDLGVDVEQLDRRVEIDQVARGVFSARELEGLLALQGDAKRRRFFELWTLKEAYIKAVGQGLSMPLRRITLDVERPVPTIDLAGAGLGDGREWQLALERLGADHQLAVAFRGSVYPDLRIAEWDGTTTANWDNL